MGDFLERNSERRKYRLTSAILIAVYAMAIFVISATRPSWGAALLAVAIGASAYLLLGIVTYYRLQDAAFSRWWLLPMIIIIHVGPRWHLGSWSWGTASFSPSGVLCFAPVVIGWLAVARTRARGATTVPKQAEDR